MKIEINGDIKSCTSDDYNYTFNMKTGEFRRWGRTIDDDPKVGPLEIFDLEVSEICDGVPGLGSDIAIPCQHCYKSNNKVGRNMSFDTFKMIFDKLPKTLTQIAFGIGNMNGNNDLRQMIIYCRENNVIPNLTINGYDLDDDWTQFLAANLGGIAVSRYENKDICYDAVKKLSDAGLHQVNIHMVIANENVDECYKLVDEVATDPRLKGVRHVLFLTLKPKGKRNTWTVVKNFDTYRNLIEYAFSKNVQLGFDSCSAPTFLMAMKNHKHFDHFVTLTESCESDRFSGYANVEGIWSHCSFTEGLSQWGTVDLKSINDFNQDVWHSPEVEHFRNCLVCQNNDHIAPETYLCPVYKLYDDRIGNTPTSIEKSDRKIINLVRM